MAWTLGAAVNHTSENAPKGNATCQPRHLSCLVKGSLVIVLSRWRRCSDLRRSWLFAPRGQNIPAQGQSEAAPAAERRPGFRSPPGAGEPNGDHHSGTPTSLNPSAPRHARSAAASFTCRLHGSRLARPPVLARWVPGAALRSAPGWYVAAPSERRSNTAWR